MTKNWMGLSLLAAALAVSASAGFACDQDAKVAEAKEAKDAKDVKAVAANGDEKGCDKPCCAHANTAANDKIAANAAPEKPCAAHDKKGCPKKPSATATTVAKAETAEETPKAEPTPTPGTNR